MPNINLIQEQRLTIKREEQKARMFFMAFASTAVLSVLAVGSLVFMTEVTNSEASSLRAQAQKIQPLVDEIEAIQSESSKLNPRFSTLENARKMTDKWNNVLKHLTSQTPNEMWLTTIRSTATDPKNPIMISFSGMTVRQELVGEFMLRLQGCPDLTNVNLKQTQEKPVQQGSQLEFQVDSSLKDTEEQKKVAIKEDAS